MVTKEKLHELRTSFIASVIKLKHNKDGISVKMKDFMDYLISGENVLLAFSGHCSIRLPLNQLYYNDSEKCFYVLCDGEKEK